MLAERIWQEEKDRIAKKLKMSGLASLTAQYTDSEGEDEAVVVKSSSNSTSPSAPQPPAARESLFRDMHRVLVAPPVAQLRLSNLHNRVEVTPNGSTGPLVSYVGHDSEGSGGEDDDPPTDGGGAEDMEDNKPVDMDLDSAEGSQSSTPSREPSRPLSPFSFHRRLLEEGSHNVILPPQPPGKCSNDLQARIADYYEKSKKGANLVDSIQRKKAFRNPSIYEKLLVHCDIDELGTNFPPEIFDSHAFKRDSYYDELSKKQTEEMNKREKERKTKVEFVVGTVAKKEVTPSAGKKSKWDQGAAAPHIQARGVAAPGVVAVPSGTKPVVISAIGNLPKPKNVVTHVQQPRSASSLPLPRVV